MLAGNLGLERTFTNMQVADMHCQLLIRQVLHILDIYTPQHVHPSNTPN